MAQANSPLLRDCLMVIQNINDIPVMAGYGGQAAGTLKSQGEEVFDAVLDRETADPDAYEPILNRVFTPLHSDTPIEARPTTLSRSGAIAAYEVQTEEKDAISDWQKYKDDQLLSNPGGDHYYHNKKEVVSHPKDQESYWGSIGKDLSDSFDNLKNCFKNLFFGADILYRDKDNQIRQATQRGVVGSIIDFFKDLGSAFSFGAWRPDNEKEPEGFLARGAFFLSKMKEAIFGDLVEGVSGSAIRMAEDIALAGWNLVEVVPDATIGSFDEGRKLTTTIFDNGQVAIDYLTDIVPTGEAWLRVHAPKLDSLDDLKAPILYNIEMPEYFDGDVRWKYVRNTPFRKAIETIGSLLADIATIKVVGETKWSSEGKKK